MNKYNSHEVNLNTFFDELNRRKKVIASYLDPHSKIEDEMDIQEINKMIYELLKLEQYQEIKQKLENSSGVVNFITGNEFPPLVAMLIKYVFPQNRNGSYLLGMEEDLTIPEDYFIDSKSTFGVYSQQEEERNLRNAQNFLRNTIFGKDIKITPANIAAILGESDTTNATNIMRNAITAFYMSRPELNAFNNESPIYAMLSSNNRIDPNYAIPIPGREGMFLATPNGKRRYADNQAQLFLERADLYQQEIERIKQDRSYTRVQELREILNDDAVKRAKKRAAKNKVIGFREEDRNNEMIYENTEEITTLTPQEYKKILTEINMLRPTTKLNIESIENSFSDLVQPQIFINIVSGRETINKTGFLNSENDNKLSSFASLFNDIIYTLNIISKSSMKSEGNVGENQIAKLEDAKSNLGAELQEFRETNINPVLIKLRNHIMKFLFAKDNEYIIKNRNTLIRLFKAFYNELSNRGKVLILDNVDKSALVGLSPEAERVEDDSGKETSTVVNKKNRFLDDDVIKEFASTNKNNMINDEMEKRQHERSENASLFPERERYGKRILLLISDTKLEGLPAETTYINLSDIKVGPLEAEVIVRHVTDSINNDVINSQIEAAKFLKESKGESVGENFEEIIKNSFERNISKLGITENDKNTLESTINGLSVTESMDLLSQAAKEAREEKVNKSEDMTFTSFKVNSEKMTKRLAELYNERQQQTAKGMNVVFPSMDFEDYIYDKDSPWGIEVGKISSIVKSVYTLTQSINLYKNQVRDLMRLCGEPNITDEQKLVYEESIIEKNKIIKIKSDERKSLMAAIPHFVILYGEPGVGKSVWGEALCNILKRVVGQFSLKMVDVGASKSKYVGETTAFIRQLCEAMFASMNTVFVLDELDRALPQGDESGVASSEYQGGIAVFLMYFQDRFRELIEKNLYVIATTNNPENIDGALESRALGHSHKVEASSDPRDYIDFIQKALKQAERKNPESCWLNNIPGNPMTAKERWAKLKEIFHQMDLTHAAEYLAKNKMGFREFLGLIESMSTNHSAFMNSVELLKRGQISEEFISKSPPKTQVGDPKYKEGILSAEYSSTFTGLPLTTRIFTYAISKIKKETEQEKLERKRRESISGKKEKPKGAIDVINEVVLARFRKIFDEHFNELLRSGQIKLDPNAKDESGNPKKQYIIPDNFIEEVENKFMSTISQDENTFVDQFGNIISCETGSEESEETENYQIEHQNLNERNREINNVINSIDSQTRKNNEEISKIQEQYEKSQNNEEKQKLLEEIEIYNKDNVSLQLCKTNILRRSQPNSQNPYNPSDPNDPDNPNNRSNKVVEEDTAGFEISQEEREKGMSALKEYDKKQKGKKSPQGPQQKPQRQPTSVFPESETPTEPQVKTLTREKTKEKTSSTLTNYLYSFLEAKGIIKESQNKDELPKNQVGVPDKIKKSPIQQSNTNFPQEETGNEIWNQWVDYEQLWQHGTIYYNNGNILMTRINDQQKPYVKNQKKDKKVNYNKTNSKKDNKKDEKTKNKVTYNKKKVKK